MIVPGFPPYNAELPRLPDSPEDLDRWPADLTKALVQMYRRLRLEDFGPAGPNHARGTVPDPGATAGSARVLYEDGVWRLPTSFLSAAASGTTTIASTSPTDITGASVTFTAREGYALVLAQWDVFITTAAATEVMIGEILVDGTAIPGTMNFGPGTPLSGMSSRFTSSSFGLATLAAGSRTVKLSAHFNTRTTSSFNVNPTHTKLAVIGLGGPLA